MNGEDDEGGREREDAAEAPAKTTTSRAPAAPDLAAEAAEWAPDFSAADGSSGPPPPSAEGAPAAGDPARQVTLIADPFVLGGPSAADIRTEQEREYDVELEAEIDAEEKTGRRSGGPDDSPEEPLALAPEDPELMARLAAAITGLEQENAQEAQALVEQRAAESALLLAAQIADDEALARAEATQAAGPGAPEEALPRFSGDPTLDVQEAMSCVEALVFMSDKPLGVQKLRELLGPDQDIGLFQEAVSRLLEQGRSPSRGIELVKVAGGLQFRTKPGRAALAKKLAKVQIQKLSSGAMETLAITAYKQPVMKEDIDKVRGVDSSYFIRILLDRKLIRISGRSELPGRPLLYSTTEEFMEVFGLEDLSALPPLREIESMIPGSQTGTDEDPRVVQLRRMVSQMNTDQSGAIQYDPKEDEGILREIRDRVKEIPTSTPFLMAQDAAARAAEALAQEAAREGGEGSALPLPLPKPMPPDAPAAES